eukprot:scaffold33513_cov24-Prasinocladus_malaysianus.AAC.1
MITCGRVHIIRAIGRIHPAGEGEERSGGRGAAAGHGDAPHGELELQQLRLVHRAPPQHPQQAGHLEAEGDLVLAAALDQVAALLEPETIVNGTERNMNGKNTKNQKKRNGRNRKGKKKKRVKEDRMEKQGKIQKVIKEKSKETNTRKRHEYQGTKRQAFKI